MVASIMAAGPLNLVTVSSITIGGGSDCKISGGLEGYAKTYFAFREVPSGTSGDVVMTFSGSANSDTAHCTLYSIVTGGNTLSNDDFVTAGSTVSTTRTLSGIDVSKNGVLLVHGAHEQAGGGATLGGTGLGSLHEGTVGGAVYAWSGYSSSLYSSAQTISNAAITATTSRTIIGASFS